jgi:hypothetical protein
MPPEASCTSCVEPVGAQDCKRSSCVLRKFYRTTPPKRTSGVLLLDNISRHCSFVRCKLTLCFNIAIGALTLTHIQAAMRCKRYMCGVAFAFCVAGSVRSFHAPSEFMTARARGCVRRSEMRCEIMNLQESLGKRVLWNPPLVHETDAFAHRGTAGYMREWTRALQRRCSMFWQDLMS